MNRQMEILIDGYNFVWKNRFLSEVFQESFEEGLNLLLELLKEYREKQGIDKIWLVFDDSLGKWEDYSFHHKGICVLFVKDADEYIRKKARALSKVKIVSSDRKDITIPLKQLRKECESSESFFRKIGKKKTGKKEMSFEDHPFPPAAVKRWEEYFRKRKKNKK